MFCPGSSAKLIQEINMKSVYFFTLHKCASSLFAKRILPMAVGLTHVNYAAQIFRYGEAAVSEAIVFRDEGFLYGPIRLSAPKDGPAYRAVVKPAIDQCLSDGCVGLVMVRDPRDILISEYYSFGFTHGISKHPEVSSWQLNVRENIASMTLDEYVLDRAPSVLANLLELYKISENCSQHEILRYEDLIEDFDLFVSRLSRHIELEAHVIADLHEQSRPREVEMPDLHKRSGRVRAYLDKLQATTIDKLDPLLDDVLTCYGYR